MRIGFDASQTGAGRAGCGWYAHGLLAGLAAVDDANEYVVYPTFGTDYWSPRAGADTYLPKVPRFRRGLRHHTLDQMQAFWRRPGNDFEARLGDPDVVHANNFFCPSGLTRARLVYTLYDLSFLDQPDWSTEANRVACFAGVYGASLRADQVVAISSYSRDRFLAHFPHFPAPRVTVVPPASRFAPGGASRRPAALRELAPGDFWLHVGTVEPRKNIEHLCEAFAAALRTDAARRRLVLAGAGGWLMGPWRRRLAELGVADLVVELGYVDDDVLRWLYENCFALVFPSRYEGFGMPALEAMSLGAPVVAANSTSLPEIVADAGMLIDANDPASTAAAMRTLQENPGRRAAMRARGLEIAARYDWTASARSVLAVYERAVGEPRRAG